MKPKKEMVRLVRPPEGAVHVDRSGKAAGRGAYVCVSNECMRKAQKTRALERALEVKIEESAYAQLELELMRREG